MRRGASGPAAKGGPVSGFPAPLPLRLEELKASSRAVYCDWHFMLTIGNATIIGVLVSSVDPLMVREVCNVTEVFPTGIAMIGLHFSDIAFILSKR